MNSLSLTNFFGTLNDNFLKTLAGFTVMGWLASERAKSIAMGATAAALVLPYILCSPLADRLTALFPKRRILRLAKWAELPIMAVAMAGFSLRSPWLVVGAVLLMGLQSSLYSPAKYALVRDIAGEANISTGMGGMEAASFLGVLLGTVAGSLVADAAALHPLLPHVCFAAFAVLGLAASFAVRAVEEPNRALHSINPVRYLRRAYRMASRHDGLNSVIFTLSVFWWGAAMLQMGILVYGKSPAGLGLDATRTGALLCAAAVGIVLGQLAAGFIDRRRFLLGATLLTGWIAATLLAVLYFAPLPPSAFAAVLALLAFDLGLFKLPFDAEIQKVVKGPRLNTMLAYFNQVSFVFMLAASGCYAAVSWLFGPKAFLLLLAIAFFLAPISFAFRYRSVLVFTGRFLFHRRYKVTLVGRVAPNAPLVGRVAPNAPLVGRVAPNAPSLDCNRLQSTAIDRLQSTAIDSNRRLPPPSPPSPISTLNSPLLVLPNHPAMVDPMLVTAELWRIPLKPLSDESFFHAGLVAPRVLKTLGAVAVPDLRKHRTAKGATIARGLGDIVLSTLESGGNVIFYPSGHIWTSPREEIGTRQLAHNICRALADRSDADPSAPPIRVIGVRTTGLWGSIWSRKNRSSSPSFVPTLLKSVFLWFFWAPFVPRRRVTIHVEDLTDRALAWSRLPRLDFNSRLEAWYNEKGW